MENRQTDASAARATEGVASVSQRPIELEFQIDALPANPLEEYGGCMNGGSCKGCHVAIDPTSRNPSPKLSVAAGNKVHVEFQIDDLINRLGLAPDVVAAHCGGCNGCSGCKF